MGDLNPLVVDCPKCGAKMGERCRAMSSGKPVGPHMARCLKWFEGHDDDGES